MAVITSYRTTMTTTTNKMIRRKSSRKVYCCLKWLDEKCETIGIEMRIDVIRERERERDNQFYEKSSMTRQKANKISTQRWLNKSDDYNFCKINLIKKREQADQEKRVDDDTQDGHVQTKSHI